jgi:hypothetical protein
MNGRIYDPLIGEIPVAIANTIMGGTAAIAEGLAGQAIAQGEANAFNHVANVAASVQAQDLPAATTAAEASGIVTQATAAIAGHVGKAEAAVITAATTAAVVSSVMEDAADQAVETQKKKDERNEH